MYIYLLGALVPVGIFGNVLSFCVFEIQRRRKGSKTLVLLMCLAFADTLYLLSNIFSRMLPTISKYVYLGEELAWSIHIRPYWTALASIFQAFASYMVLAVTLHRYVIVAKPLKANLWMNKRNTAALVLGLFLFSVAFNIPRFFELHVECRCNECLGVYLPTQRRTELGENIYFNIIYTIVLRTILRGLIPVVTVVALTRGLVKVSARIHAFYLAVLSVSDHCQVCGNLLNSFVIASPSVSVSPEICSICGRRRRALRGQNQENRQSDSHVDRRCRHLLGLPGQ